MHRHDSANVGTNAHPDTCCLQKRLMSAPRRTGLPVSCSSIITQDSAGWKSKPTSNLSNYGTTCSVLPQCIIACILSSMHMTTLGGVHAVMQTVPLTACTVALSSLLSGSAYAAEPAEVFQRSGCVGEWSACLAHLTMVSSSSLSHQVTFEPKGMHAFWTR